MLRPDTPSVIAGHGGLAILTRKVIKPDALRVIDALIVPTMVSSNTNVAAIIIVENGADMPSHVA